MSENPFLTVYVGVVIAWAIGLLQGSVMSWGMGLPTANRRMAAVLPAFFGGAFLMMATLAYSTRGLLP